MKYKAIIFDADGMVIPKPIQFSEKLSKELNIPIDDILEFFENDFEDCKTGKADLKEKLKNYLPKWSWKKGVDDLVTFWHKSEHFINDEILEIIKQLRSKGIKCYLATDQDKYRTEYIKNTMGMGKAFDAVFSSADLGTLKTNREFYSIIFGEMQKELPELSKAQVLFWDHEEEKLEPAREFGFNVKKYTDMEIFNKFIRKQ